MNAEKLKQLQDQVRIGGKVCNVFMQNLTRLNNILTKFRAYTTVTADVSQSMSQ